MKIMTCDMRELLIFFFSFLEMDDDVRFDYEMVFFLESHDKGLKLFGNEDAYLDDDGMQSADEDGANINKMLTSSAFSSWCHLVKRAAYCACPYSLLNGYRAACHYGTELTGVLDAVSCHNIQDSDTFCNILKIMLREADNIFRGMLGISSLKLQEGNHFGSEEMNTSKIKMENSEATDQVLSKKYPVHVESGN
ncbi:hypothetical protein ACOSQ2_018062 [Xanthoceras sorbifolium]